MYNEAVLAICLGHNFWPWIYLYPVVQDLFWAVVSTKMRLAEDLLY
jgi:hypothetical protein